MTARPVRRADVLGRAPRGSFRVVSPADFDLGGWRGLGDGDRPAGFVPYCLDADDRRSLYAGAGNVRAVRRAKLQYQYLRERATVVLSLPWERGRLYGGLVPPAVFVFSVGRCGSTLFFEVMRNCGVFSLSEPDFYTQAVGISLFPRPLSQSSLLTTVVADLTADLVGACGGSAAPEALIKLRAQCCKAPDLIVGAQAGAHRTLFMIRTFERWAASSLRASARPPHTVVERYIEGLHCLQWLRNHTDCHLVTYEDLIENPDATLVEAARRLTLTMSPKGLKRALRTDSQAGTGLARDRLAMRAIEPGALTKAVELWREVRPARLLRELGMAEYC